MINTFFILDSTNPKLNENKYDLPIVKWCKETLVHYQWFPFYQYNGKPVIKFVIRDNAEALLFKLRWLPEILNK